YQRNLGFSGSTVQGDRFCSMFGARDSRTARTRWTGESGDSRSVVPLCGLFVVVNMGLVLCGMIWCRAMVVADPLGLFRLCFLPSAWFSGARQVVSRSGKTPLWKRFPSAW